MLDELVIEDSGRRYVGHVWVAPAQPLVAPRLALQWRFAHCGHLVAEFPATPLDTADEVRARLLRILARIEGRRQERH